MRNTFKIMALTFLLGTNAFAQNYSAELNTYFLSDETFLLPIVSADVKQVHFEGRYNYEDFETTSVFVGYNFTFGRELSFVLTPMIGGAAGNTEAVIPALEFLITYKRLTLYSEQEFLIDLSGEEGNFYYQWTDLTYSLEEWMRIGLSLQRTRLYETDTDIDYGVSIDFGQEAFSVGGYYYNFDTENPVGILTMSASF